MNLCTFMILYKKCVDGTVIYYKGNLNNDVAKEVDQG